MENMQNVLKFKIPEHFLIWITISGVKKSKTPYFPIYPCNRIPSRIFRNIATQHPQLVYNGIVSIFIMELKKNSFHQIKRGWNF